MNTHDSFNVYTARSADPFKRITIKSEETYDLDGREFRLYRYDEKSQDEPLHPYHPYRYISNGNLYAHALKVYTSQPSNGSDQLTADAITVGGLRIDSSVGDLRVDSSSVTIRPPVLKSNPTGEATTTVMSGSGDITASHQTLAGSINNRHAQSSMTLENHLDHQQILKVETHPDGTLKRIKFDLSKVDTIDEVVNGKMSITFKQS